MKIHPTSIRRKGAALIMALVAMAIITIVLSVITAQVVSQRQGVRQRQRQLQAEWLARAGAERAAARLLQSAEAFVDEQQQLAPDSKVRIAVTKVSDDTFVATVDSTVGISEGRPVARTLSTRFRRSEKDGVVLLETLAHAEADQGKLKTPPGKEKDKKSPAEGAGEQKKNLAKLKIDLEAIHGKSEVTAAQKQAIVKDLQAILSMAHKPSQASIQTFANDLSKALADGKISTVEAMKLTQDIQAVLASANISQQDAQKLMKDVQTLLKATNLSQADVQTIYRDVQAIVTTAQQNHPKKK